MDKNSIITYIMTTPYNTNWSVLSTMLGAGDWSKLKAYVENTSHNMNRRVLEALVGGVGGAAIVCEAIVCEAVVG